MIKRLLALPFVGLALVAAKDAPPPAKPALSIAAPAEIAADPANRWSLELSNGGTVVIQLRPDIAPQHVYRIQQLTSQGFYNGLTFHRVIPGFMAQGGDPQGTGIGGSPLPDLSAEFNDLPHLRGVASMARAQDPNSANSQFFIMLAPRFSLDHEYTAFGRVIAGMAAADQIATGEPPAEPTRIVRATIGGPLPAPPPVAAAAAATAPSTAAPAVPSTAAPPAPSGPEAEPAAPAVDAAPSPAATPEPQETAAPAEVTDAAGEPQGEAAATSSEETPAAPAAEEPAVEPVQEEPTPE